MSKLYARGECPDEDKPPQFKPSQSSFWLNSYCRRQRHLSDSYTWVTAVCVGQNKRYAELLEEDFARASDKIDHQVRAVGLSEPELKGSSMRQQAREPVPVAARVPRQVLWTEPQLVEAEAIA